MNVENRRTIAYVGQLLLEKGVHCLLAALPAVAAQVPAVHLLVIGGGVARGPLEAMVEALSRGDLNMATHHLAQVATTSRARSWLLPVTRFWEQVDEAVYLPAATGLLERVRFTGHLPHETVAEVLPEAELLVIPSLVKEGFPLVSLEALAAGVLPLGTDHGGLKPVLDEIAAALDLPKDLIRVKPQPERLVADLAEKIVRLLDYLAAPGAREAVSHRCRTLAVQKYEWEHIVDRIERVYTEVGIDHA